MTLDVYVLLWTLNLSLVQKFASQFDFYFPLFQIMIMNMRQ